MQLTIKEYFESYISESTTIQCLDCGDRVKVDSNNCWSFGVYLCYPCRRRWETEINNRMDREN